MKSKFNIIYEQIMNNIIIESGNAVENCVPIKKQFIEPTLNNIQQKLFTPLNITKDMWTIVGSVGKKDISGDIDIAMNIDQVKDILEKQTYQEVKDNLTEFFNKQGFYTINTKKFNSINLVAPIIGEQDQNVQVDIFFTKDLNYTKFKRFSPSNQESKYKGKIRGILLDSLLQEITTQSEDQISQPIQVKGKKYPSSTFSHISLGDDQIFRNVQSFLKKNGSIGVTKNTLKDRRTYMGYDYLNIIRNLLHMDINESDLNSFETIWNNIILNPKFPYKDKINDIKEHVIALLKVSFKQEYQKYIPEEIK